MVVYELIMKDDLKLLLELGEGREGSRSQDERARPLFCDLLETKGRVEAAELKHSRHWLIILLLLFISSESGCVFLIEYENFAVVLAKARIGLVEVFLICFLSLFGISIFTEASIDMIKHVKPNLEKHRSAFLQLRQVQHHLVHFLE